MNADQFLASLRSLPRPKLSPFFAARVVSECGTTHRPPVRTPLVLRAYWLVLAFFAGVVLLQSWIGVAMIIAATAVVALTPAGVLMPTASRRGLRR